MMDDKQVLKLIHKLMKERDIQERGSSGYYERSFAIAQLNLVLDG